MEINLQKKENEGSYMRENNFNKLGFYRPSFFRIHVHTTDSLLDLNKIDDLCSPIYLHEYIHFLQDISTTYGLMNICSVVEYLKAANNQIIKQTEPNFTVPFTIDPTKFPKVIATQQLNLLYIGSGSKIENPYVKGLNLKNELVNLGAKSLPINRIIINYSDLEGDKEYAFGSYCICESMAYLIEKTIYPDSPEAPAFPYKTANIVADKIYPSFGSEISNVIALCDASLMYFNPADVFYSMLELMIHKRFVPSNPEEIYEFVFSNYSFNYNGISDYKQLFIYMCSLAISQMNDYFTTELFKDNKEWVQYTITNAVDLRLKIINYILDIAQFGDIKGNKLFNATFRKIGTPYVINDNYEASFYSQIGLTKDVVPEYLWAINQIYKIFFSKSIDGGVLNNTYKCEMINWCQQTCVDKKISDWTDERCRNAPWERSCDPDPNYCTFGRMWKTWGLEKYSPLN